MTMRKIILFAALLAALPAAAQSSSRARKGEIYLAPLFTEGKSYSFEGGSTARTDTGTGLSFGYAYNFDSRVSAGFDIAWSQMDYRATVNPVPGTGNPNGPSTINGTIETRIFRFNGTYHFLSGNITPYVSGGLGWTYVDTNIPSGLPDYYCWYYPWYGQYCAGYVPTRTTTKFSYNVGLGMRLDAGTGVFRLFVNQQSIDFGSSYQSYWTQLRVDFGTKF
jgi:opacity protein-like surface antigen